MGWGSGGGGRNSGYALHLSLSYSTPLPLAVIRERAEMKAELEKGVLSLVLSLSLPGSEINCLVRSCMGLRGEGKRRGRPPFYEGDGREEKSSWGTNP